jgi:hypothetical protein
MRDSGQAWAVDELRRDWLDKKAVQRGQRRTLFNHVTIERRDVPPVAASANGMLNVTEESRSA